MTDPVILVDGSSYLFRAFYALPHLKSPQGEPSGAILGVMNMLKRLLKDHDPQHIGIIFDPKGKNFRHDIYPEYKANRSAMPEDLSCQIQATFNMIELMGLPLIIVDGVEADDVIGSLSKQLVAQNRTVLISSSDKDLAQLIEPGVSIIDTMKDVHIDAALVEQKYGVRPDQIIDLLALAGDTSDNIPGIPSVGMKTAAKWLQQYDSLENLLAHSSEIKGKVGEKLRDNEDLAHLSKRLTTIKCDVDIKIDLSLKIKYVSGLPSIKFFIDFFKYIYRIISIRVNTNCVKFYFFKISIYCFYSISFFNISYMFYNIIRICN